MPKFKVGNPVITVCKVYVSPTLTIPECMRGIICKIEPDFVEGRDCWYRLKGDNSIQYESTMLEVFEDGIGFRECELELVIPDSTQPDTKVMSTGANIETSLSEKRDEIFRAIFG